MDAMALIAPGASTVRMCLGQTLPRARSLSGVYGLVCSLQLLKSLHPLSPIFILPCEP
jgi:hypothetical protein